MLYAVTIKPLNTICFVSERPEDSEWEVQEGVSLDLAPIFGTWTPDLGPLRQNLCVSNSDPKRFKVFINDDIDSSEFRPTGQRFGGVFSKAIWGRFAELLSRTLATPDVSVEEPPGATERAVAAIKQRG